MSTYIGTVYILNRHCQQKSVCEEKKVDSPGEMVKGCPEPVGRSGLRPAAGCEENPIAQSWIQDTGWNGGGTFR